MKTTRKDLEQNYEVAQHEITCLSFALLEVLNDKVIWLKEGKIKAGIVRPTSASGGVVIIRRNDDKGFPRVYYLEKWVAEISKTPSPSRAGDHDGSYYNEWQDQQELARRVMISRNQEIEAENKAAMDRA